MNWFFDNYSINNICNAENNKAEYTGVKPVYIRYSRNSGENEIILNTKISLELEMIRKKHYNISEI